MIAKKENVKIQPAFIRQAEAARFLGISPRCLRDWMRKGVLPFYKPARKVCMFSATELEQAMQKYRVAEKESNS